MKSGRRILERVVHGSDLDTEPIPMQPLIEVVGHRRVIIENHQGVTQYTCEEISVRVNYGHIVIFGNALEVAQMTKERLIIIGQIGTVRLCTGGGAW